MFRCRIGASPHHRSGSAKVRRPTGPPGATHRHGRTAGVACSMTSEQDPYRRTSLREGRLSGEPGRHLESRLCPCIHVLNGVRPTRTAKHWRRVEGDADDATTPVASAGPLQPCVPGTCDGEPKDRPASCTPGHHCAASDCAGCRGDLGRLSAPGMTGGFARPCTEKRASCIFVLSDERQAGIAF